MASALRSFLNSEQSDDFDETKAKQLADQQRRSGSVEKTIDMVETAVRSYMRASANEKGEFGEIIRRSGFKILRNTSRVVTALLVMILVLQAVALLAVLLDPTRLTRQLAMGAFLGTSILQCILLIVSVHNYLVSVKDQQVHSAFMRFGIGKTVASELASVNESELGTTTEAGDIKGLKDYVGELIRRIDAENNENSASLFSLPRAERLADNIARSRSLQAGLMFGSLAGATALSAVSAGSLGPESEVEAPSAGDVAESRTAAGAAKALVDAQLASAAAVPRTATALSALTSRDAKQTAALQAMQATLAALTSVQVRLEAARAEATSLGDMQQALRTAAAEVASARTSYGRVDKSAVLVPAVDTPPTPEVTVGSSITASEEDALGKVFEGAKLGEAVAKAKADVPPTDHRLRGLPLVGAIGAAGLSLASVITSGVMTRRYYSLSYVSMPKFYNEANYSLLRNLSSVKKDLRERIRLAQLFQLSEDEKKLREVAANIPGLDLGMGVGGFGDGVGMLAGQAIGAAAAGGFPPAGYPPAVYPPGGYVPAGYQ